MISKNSIHNIVHKLHLDDFVKSQREFLKDNKGGFLIPIEAKVTDEEYKRYRNLPIDWSLSPITSDDLPDEFSEKAVKTVDMFRRKTHNLDIECMIYFDIETGNIVSCNFADKNKPDEVSGEIYADVLKNMHISSVHNRPKQFYSPPSCKNFEMLSLDFEEYELIFSQRELWILESKEMVSDEKIKNIRKNAKEYFDFISENTHVDLEKNYLIIDNMDFLYGNFLLDYLNNDFDNIKLTRRYLDG